MLLQRSEFTETEGAERMSKPQVRDGYKETVFSGHSKAASHMNSQKFTAHIRLAKDSSKRREGGHSHH